MNLKQQRNLVKNLPRGSQSKIARNLGLSRSTVNMVLLGYRTNHEVIAAAVEMAAAYKANQANMKKNLKTL
jgi:DNA transposition AAA+ family ATPase